MVDLGEPEFIFQLPMTIFNSLARSLVIMAVTMGAFDAQVMMTRLEFSVLLLPQVLELMIQR